MNFIEAISSGLNNYFNFKDRASKSAFWYFLLFEFIYFFSLDIFLNFSHSFFMSTTFKFCTNKSLYTFKSDIFFC